MDARVPPELVGYLIGDVSRMIRRVYDRRVEHLGLTRAQWRVLTRLNRRQGCTQTELAAALEIEKPTLGKLIQRLEAKGWVERRADARDARTRRLYLTETAEPLIAEMFALAADVQDEIFAGLSASEAARLHDTLAHLKANLAAMLAEGQTELQSEPRPEAMEV